MKITKAQWDAFWVAVHGKSEHFYYDDSDIDPTIDEPSASASEVFNITVGELCYGGPGEQSFEIPGILTRAQVGKAIEDRATFSLTAALKRYLNSLTHVTLVSTIPRDQEDSFRRRVSELGGEVQG